ncbi:hypothetical protein NQ317_017136, partial [Molorchus minor]
SGAPLVTSMHIDKIRSLWLTFTSISSGCGKITTDTVLRGLVYFEINFIIKRTKGSINRKAIESMVSWLKFGYVWLGPEIYGYNLVAEILVTYVTKCQPNSRFLLAGYAADIRSFFTVVSKKTGTGNSNERSEKPIHEKVKKKPQVIVDSDEDIIESPQGDKRQNCNGAPSESKKVENGQSDNKKKKKKPKTEIGIHGDVDFEKTLLDLDDDLLVDNMDILDKTIEEAWQNKDENRRHSQNDSQIAEDSTPSKSNKKRQRKNSGGGSENKKAKLDHTDSGIDPDQEAFEKKRYSAMLYQKYKNRGGPKHHGEKEIPQGKPDCLKGSTFLRTGKVSYLVVGDDPGPSKLDKARGLNIPEITENDLLDMILVKSGMKAKFNKSISEVSVESGIATEEESSPKPKKKHTSHKEKEKLEVQHEKVKESGSSSKSKLNDDKSKTKNFQKMT